MDSLHDGLFLRHKFHGGGVFVSFSHEVIARGCACVIIPRQGIPKAKECITHDGVAEIPPEFPDGFVRVEKRDQPPTPRRIHKIQDTSITFTPPPLRAHRGGCSGLSNVPFFPFPLHFPGCASTEGGVCAWKGGTFEFANLCSTHKTKALSSIPPPP